MEYRKLLGAAERHVDRGGRLGVVYRVDGVRRAPCCGDERSSAYDRVEQHLTQFTGLVARLARNLIAHCRRLTTEIDELADEISQRVEQVAPSLLAVVGCGALTAAKIIGETAGADRFRSKDVFARHNGTAPLPVWSSNRARHRLSRTGNRNSTPLFTASHSPKLAATRKREHYWHAAKPAETEEWKPCESSNAGSPTSSSAP